MQIRITRILPTGSASTTTLDVGPTDQRGAVRVTGVLPHNSTWAPASDLDAAVLRDWLEANYNIEREPAEPNREPRPGHPKLPPSPLKLHFSSDLLAPHRYWVRVLNFREPKKGEFYMSGAIPEIYQAPNNLATKFWIVEILEESEKENFHEYA